MTFDELAEFDFTPEEMRQRAAEAEWVWQDYFDQHWRRHRYDWSAFPKGLTRDQYARLTQAATMDRDNRIFTFLYGDSIQWGFFCDVILFDGNLLSNVAVVYDLKWDAIRTCYRAQEGAAHFLEKEGVREVR